MGGPVSNYFRYLLNRLLRSMWSRGVEEFKKGMLSHDDSQQKSEVGHSQKQPAVKKDWEAQFVRFCRASGLATRRTKQELRASKGSTEDSSSRTCPKCGRTYQGSGAKFCPEDGTKLVNGDAWE